MKILLDWPVRTVRLRRHLTASFSLLLLCIMLLPAGLTVNDGLSFYGGQSKTVFFFIPSVFLYGLALRRGGRALSRRYDIATLRTVFAWMLVALGGLALTPYNAADPIGLVHNWFALMLFALQLWVGAWLMTGCRHKSDFIFISLLIGSAVVAIVSLPDVWRYELAGQAAFQLTFIAFMVRHIGPNGHPVTDRLSDRRLVYLNHAQSR